MSADRASSLRSSASGARPLGRNHGRYAGERIEIGRVLDELRWAASAAGWVVEDFGAPGFPGLIGLRRGVGGGEERSRVYLSSGIHGDEPAGPLAVLELIRRNTWPRGCSLWVCPCLNPTGCGSGTRESSGGVDLNREYREPSAPEVRAHVAWLEAQPRFDLALCLHEDWEAKGFYLYELNPDHRASRAELVIEAVRRVCPVDPSPVIEGREAVGGIIRPILDPVQRPQWPEAFYLIQRKTRHSLTLEAPSDFELPVRVAALVAAVEAAMVGSSVL